MKNTGLAAFWGSKTQPSRGFGGSEALKPRILRGFGGSGTVVFRPGRRETTYFMWFWNIWGSKIAPRRPPGGFRTLPGGPGGGQEAPRRPRRPKIALKPRIYTCFTRFPSQGCAKTLRFRRFPAQGHARTSCCTRFPAQGHTKSSYFIRLPAQGRAKAPRFTRLPAQRHICWASKIWVWSAPAFEHLGLQRGRLRGCVLGARQASRICAWRTWNLMPSSCNLVMPRSWGNQPV